MSYVEVWGISNCDTVKKACDWLAARGLAYTFHDYKKAGADPAQLAQWCEIAGWETVLNRAGTTFRKLPDTAKSGLDAAKAVVIMAANPACIKRPIAVYAGGLLVGFKPDQWAAAL